MPNNAEYLELELKTGFLILFGSVCGLLFGSVGLFVAFICFVLLLHVVITFNRNDQKKNHSIQVMEAKQEPTKQEKETEAETENSKLDDLLLLDPV